ncbi:MAG: hypothetical protein ACC628_18920 [Pirellulaceae bacterium]
MKLQIDCPDRKTLKLLLLGKLPTSQTEPLAEHLLHCDQCEQIAETIDATDDVTAAFASKEILHGEDEIVAQVIERGKQLRSRAETMQTDETSIGKHLPQPGQRRMRPRTALARTSTKRSTSSLQRNSPMKSAVWANTAFWKCWVSAGWGSSFGRKIPSWSGSSRSKP